MNIPDRAPLLAAHRALAQELKQRRTSKAFPSHLGGSKNLLGMAVKYELPFKRDREGAGFQDAVIYSSVLDHLTMDAERIGALLTNDDVFEQDSVKALTTTARGQI